MSAALVLPFVWAYAEPLPESEIVRMPPLELAFYRSYTEAILLRYVRLSMEAGKVPSLLGKEMFRGNVTSYKVGSFDDVVIFVHDVEHCLEKLGAEYQELVTRIALQQYTIEETAAYLHVNPRTVVRRYRMAMDRLTRLFLHAQILEPQRCCQG